MSIFSFTFCFKINYLTEEPILKKHKINEEIKFPSLHLIDEEGKSQGEVSRDQALLLAYSRGYDLVLINPSARPPVCRLLDYSKYRYQLEKRQKGGRQKGLKEIRFGMKIGEFDFDVKTKRARELLEKGYKVKATVVLKGREMGFLERAYALLEKFKEKTEGVQEGERERMGNRISVLLRRGSE